MLANELGEFFRMWPRISGKAPQMSGTCKSLEEHKLLVLVEQMFTDLMRKYHTMRRHLTQDLRTLRSRFMSEGVSFLTKTLPKLGKALDESLGSETGELVVPREFKRSHENPRFPAFMQGLFIRFDRSRDSLDGLDVEVFKDIRQILFAAYKYAFPHTQVQERTVIDSFISTEQELSGFELPVEDTVCVLARKLITEVFGKRGAPGSFDARAIVPRHGPGAVATGERYEGKWQFSRLYDSLHRKWPYWRYFIAGGGRELADREEWYRSMPRLSSGCAKVVLVPKDSRGPRLISCEPLEFQWIQQGLGRELVKWLESHPLTKGQVNFRDQKVNGKLALEQSKYQYYATLDLKDASDRVHCSLVEHLFQDNLSEFLLAARTDATKLPNGNTVKLSKYAPMGSALCFPVEAVCFWALSVAAIANSESKSLQLAAREVYVYGDDIICPSHNAELVMQTLERFALKVNRGKSFYRGPFRESCGVDALCGVNVTPVKIKTRFPSKPTDASGLAAYCAYANALDERGYHNAASYLWNQIQGVYGKIPYGTPDSGYPCKHVRSSFHAIINNDRIGFKQRFNPALQVVQLKCRAVIPQKRETTLDDWQRMLRNFCFPGDERPSEVVLTRSTQIQTRWRRVA